jgi:hypothetical protein
MFFNFNNGIYYFTLSVSKKSKIITNHYSTKLLNYIQIATKSGYFRIVMFNYFNIYPLMHQQYHIQ